jgi:hypothetical protein
LEAAKGPDGASESTPAAQLQAQLDEERQRRAEAISAKAKLEQELTSLRTESENVRTRHFHILCSADLLKFQLANKFDAAQSTGKEQLDRINEMSRLLDQRTRELENARSLALSTSSRESTPKSAGPSVRSESSNLREQITGLKCAPTFIHSGHQLKQICLKTCYTRTYEGKRHGIFLKQSTRER